VDFDGNILDNEVLATDAGRDLRDQEAERDRSGAEAAGAEDERILASPQALGDISTLADPAVVEDLVRMRAGAAA